MNSFYLTLHSDESSISGKINKVSCFKVHLGHELFLDGRWEVGLAEIFYPETFRLMSKRDARFRVGNKLENESAFVELTQNNDGLDYVDKPTLLQMLQSTLSNHEIMFDTSKSQIELHSPKQTSLHFSEPMKEVLGLPERKLDLSKAVKSCKEVNVKRALPPQLFVSTDLINNQLVGGSYDRLLRIVAVKKSSYTHGGMGYVKYDRIHYYPVAQHRVDDIQMYIKDRQGKCLSFESGTLTVVLHFRKVSNE